MCLHSGEKEVALRPNWAGKCKKDGIFHGGKELPREWNYHDNPSIFHCLLAILT